MMKTLSHWGILAECEAAGAHSPLQPARTGPAPALVLTPAGELLVHRAPVSSEVAIIIARGEGALTVAQTAAILKAWDVAVALAEGDSEAVHLQPVPSRWHFARDQYLTLEEWHSQKMPHEKAAKGGSHDHTTHHS